jgi:hypothetical protein
MHHLQKYVACLTSVAIALLIAEFVYDEQQVDEIAAGTKFLVASIRIAVGAQEFNLTLQEERATAVTGSEDSVAVNPTSGLVGSLFPKGVCSVVKRSREREEVRDDIIRWG